MKNKKREIKALREELQKAQEKIEKLEKRVKNLRRGPMEFDKERPTSHVRPIPKPMYNDFKEKYGYTDKEMKDVIGVIIENE